MAIEITDINNIDNTVAKELLENWQYYRIVTSLGYLPFLYEFG